MERIVLVLPDGTSEAQWISLRDWLDGESELRGHLELVAGAAPPGRLSGDGVVTAISVAAGSGGALTVLISGIVSWLRLVARQPVPVKVSVALSDGGSVSIETAVACAWTHEQLAVQIASLVDRASQAEARGPAVATPPDVVARPDEATPAAEATGSEGADGGPAGA
jgi:hypothetical protein